jgi:hypothetical protein
MSFNQLIYIHLYAFRVAAQKLLEYEAKNGCPYSVEDATIGTVHDCTDDDDDDDDDGE